MQRELKTNKEGNGFKNQHNQKVEEKANAEKSQMTMQETMDFFTERLPLLRIQDEHDSLLANHYERRVLQLELQVREVQAIEQLSAWKANQDANLENQAKRKEHEEKMKAEWDAMTPEQQEEWKIAAKANIALMEQQEREAEQAKQVIK